MFDEFASSFKAFKKSEKSVSVIYENEIFTLKHLSKDEYILYGEYIIFENDNDTYYIPFPIDSLLNSNNGIPRIKTDSFDIDNISYNDLKEFFSVYRGISLTENTVKGDNFILMLSEEVDNVQVTVRNIKTGRKIGE